NLYRKNDGCAPQYRPWREVAGVFFHWGAAVHPNRAGSMPIGYNARNALMRNPKRRARGAKRPESFAPLLRRNRYKCPDSANSVCLRRETGPPPEHPAHAERPGDVAELLGMNHSGDVDEHELPAATIATRVGDHHGKTGERRVGTRLHVDPHLLVSVVH